MRAGSTFIKLGSSVPETPSPLGGHSTAKCSIATSNVWTHTHASVFDVRMGPNYEKYKRKAPSENALMDLVGMDLVQCDSRIDHIASKVALNPSWNYTIPGISVPSLIVINVQLPSNFSSSLFSDVSDGNGWSLVFYYRLNDDVSASLVNGTASPAARLWARYASEVASSSKAVAAWAGRFKVILSCENLEEFKLPSFITSYNAKPVLIRNTATFFRRDCYLEIDVNVHKFGNAPKKALESLMTRFDKMVINVGFCIESRSDDEMPECLFGCGQLIRPLYSAAPHWRDVDLPQPHIVSVPYGKKPHIEAHDDAEVAISRITLASATAEETRPHSLSSPLPANSSSAASATSDDGVMPPPPPPACGDTSSISSGGGCVNNEEVFVNAQQPSIFNRKVK